jgi:hypothetical protein
LLCGPPRAADLPVQVGRSLADRAILNATAVA